MSRYINFGVVPDPYSIFNPPDYHQQMISDPTQIPAYINPYGSGGYSPYGPWPGFYTGQRTYTHADMMRDARERQKFMERRAETSDDPSHRYLAPEGRLKGPAGSVLRALKAKKPTPEQKDVAQDLQKKIITTVIIGAVLSALLK